MYARFYRWASDRIDRTELYVLSQTIHLLMQEHLMDLENVFKMNLIMLTLLIWVVT